MGRMNSDSFASLGIVALLPKGERNVSGKLRARDRSPGRLSYFSPVKGAAAGLKVQTDGQSPFNPADPAFSARRSVQGLTITAACQINDQ